MCIHKKKKIFFNLQRSRGFKQLIRYINLKKPLLWNTFLNFGNLKTIEKSSILLDNAPDYRLCLGVKDHLFGGEKAMASHSSTLAWKIPWVEEPGRLQSMGSLRVGHDWETSLSLFTFMHWRRKWQPSPVFLPGESQGRGSLVVCHLWGRTESDSVEHDWSDLAVASCHIHIQIWFKKKKKNTYQIKSLNRIQFLDGMNLFQVDKMSGGPYSSN